MRQVVPFYKDTLRGRAAAFSVIKQKLLSSHSTHSLTAQPACEHAFRKRQQADPLPDSRTGRAAAEYRGHHRKSKRSRVRVGRGSSERCVSHTRKDSQRRAYPAVRVPQTHPPSPCRPGRLGQCPGRHRKVGEAMKDTLKDSDYGPLPSNPNIGTPGEHGRTGAH